MEYTFEKFDGSSITDVMLGDAAQLFSSHYGIWGPLTETKQGRRVRMSARVLREQCLPSSTTARNVYVRVRSGDTLIGNVCATRWTYEGKSMCWVTQLCVSLEFRRKGLATKVRYPGRNQQAIVNPLARHRFSIRPRLAYSDSLILATSDPQRRKTRPWFRHSKLAPCSDTCCSSRIWPWCRKYRPQYDRKARTSYYAVMSSRVCPHSQAAWLPIWRQRWHRFLRRYWLLCRPSRANSCYADFTQ